MYLRELPSKKDWTCSCFHFFVSFLHVVFSVSGTGLFSALACKGNCFVVFSNTAVKHCVLLCGYMFYVCVLPNKCLI